ncbi:MAG: MotA/TolQ/ExbB proton channel family protein [Arcobacter sp.]|jgi:biopolymer transport protein ExbB/TolQ|uniref:Tol-Pal system subunit TolQ n=1 Tax=Arcobacter defluvii TaxID=873191 RepID=A0AAE7BER2_9BACT|nr:MULTISPECIES: MotA/TolQ/ExbB proton channel family protein [Arcobacter]MDY3200310.1 MotA/TolQ/ExbB proton channel family protein [Arcobacter sp.]QKF78130.1 Tol-Pal system subunit TolQ [Arcobacter defluvii]RXI33240.1 MotA/TolQ/ExbB proton channel family protein [Arcobacter defluvii]BAK73945.1 biopolymer transport protein ExbB [Arcobacter sp. L]
MITTLLNYLANSSAITYIVLALLSTYLIITFWVFFYRNSILNSLLSNEKKSLEALTSREARFSPLSALNKCSNNSTSKELLHACEINIVKDASNGLSWLAIISSTSPFIGLFGTVVGILESFAKFANQSKVAFSIIAPAISEALVATAAGILVAIFAYTFHQILTRKVYELNIFLKAQSQILIAKG